MARSISFTVDGDVQTLITIEELPDGTLLFNVEVLDTGYSGDLRGIFFDLNETDASDANLSVTGSGDSSDIVTNSVFDEGNVDRVEGDVNIKGTVEKEQGEFDVGVSFGTPGAGEDFVTSVSFVLASDDGALSLDNLDLSDFGLRYTSVGPDGDDSSKIAGDSSGVARNDVFTVIENSFGDVDLLSNDTNGILADGTRKTVVSVVDENGAFVDTGSGFERQVVIDGLDLGTLTVSYDGIARFEADGPDVDRLAHDALEQWAFTYETISPEGNRATADTILSIDGQNDQPVAQNLFFEIDEDNGTDPRDPSLDGAGLTASFEATDIDDGDVLSFEIVSEVQDAFGNQYGSVTNNNDGTFTFNPMDNFQFLEAGESRVVTFDYVARDDSGVGTSPVSPEESDTSEVKTVEITVTGLDDDPVTLSDSYVFMTEDQNMWGPGDAFILDPDLPFLGIDAGDTFSSTLIRSRTFDGGPLEDIIGGFFDLVDLIFGTDTPDEIKTPSVSLQGGIDAMIGFQPYFYLTGGDVDAEVGVDVAFTAPRQVEVGDTFNIESAYLLADDASFDTQSPELRFGLDFVFDLDTNLDLVVGSSTLGSGFRTSLFDIDTARLGLEGELGAPGINIFDFDSGEDLQTEIDLPAGSSLTVEFPEIQTEGVKEDNTTIGLTEPGEDQIAQLNIDIDNAISTAAGFPNLFGASFGDGLEVDVGVGELNLISYNVAWDIIDVRFITTLNAIQDFSVEIDDLPLKLLLEDGTELTGLSVGDDIAIEAPTDFDVETMGDMDGLMDFDVEIDMDAIFSNLTTLGLTGELFTGLLKLTGGVSSDFFDGFGFNLFSNQKNGSTTNDSFLLSDTFDIFDAELPPIFEESFDLGGFNTVSSDADTFYFDIA